MDATLRQGLELLRLLVAFGPMAALAISLLLVDRRWQWVTPAIERIRIVALVAGVVVVLQVFEHGLPLGYGVLGGWIVAAVCSPNPRSQPAWVSAMRGVAAKHVLAVTVGLAIVVAMQTTLGYLDGDQTGRVEDWRRDLGLVRSALQPIVFLGVAKLTIVLGGLVVTSIVVAPGLRLMRSYRRVSQVATHALIAVTVATSFTLFGGVYVRGWQHDWIARHGSDIRFAAMEVDDNDKMTIKLAALVDAIQSIPPARRDELRTLETSILEQAAGGDVRMRVLDALGRELDVAAIEARIERAAPPIETGTMDRVRSFEVGEREVELDDLDAINIERSRSAAAVAEGEAALVDVVTTVIAKDSLWIEPMRSLLHRLPVTGSWLGRAIGLATARARIRAGAPPPVWNVELSGRSGEASTARAIVERAVAGHPAPLRLGGTVVDPDVGEIEFIGKDRHPIRSSGRLPAPRRPTPPETLHEPLRLREWERTPPLWERAAGLEVEEFSWWRLLRNLRE
jgi:hypothetical protein